MKKPYLAGMRPAAPIVLLQAMGVGALFVEAWQLGATIGSRFALVAAHLSSVVEIACVGLLAGGIAGYVTWRGGFRKLVAIIVSRRLDLLLAALWGVLAAVWLSEVTQVAYAAVIACLSLLQLSLVTATPLLIATTLLIGAIRLRPNTGAVVPLFIRDDELERQEDDLLGVATKARRFAAQVLNGGSTESMVFGLDAPWGIGKSTFVNFCKQEWAKQDDPRVSVFSFSPLRYEDRSKLIEVFVDGLGDTIRSRAFAPGIGRLLRRYSRLLKGTSHVSLFGVSLTFAPERYRVDDALDDLTASLEDGGRRIIVVIDDLDRVPLAIAKDMLFVIKKSFALPNVSYVLCYDTENLVRAAEPRANAAEVIEFLEKFVNVKSTLFVGSRELDEYVSENLTKALAGNSQADPELVSAAIGGLRQILQSPDYHKYATLVGDIRKLKRLINIVLYLDIGSTDFPRSDFDSQDLIHLLLLYLNYPSVFRKIMNTEMNGRRFFFSVMGPYDRILGHLGSGDPSRDEAFTNGPEFSPYLQTIEPQAQLLVKKVFDVTERLVVPKLSAVSEEARRTYACFNGGMSNTKNLVEYLNLIVNLAKPVNTTQFKFYVDLKNAILGGRTLDDVLSQAEFAPATSEEPHRSLWRTLVNSASEFDKATMRAVVRALLSRISTYSFYSDEARGLGLRDDLPYLLVKLLDSSGWSDQNLEHRENNDKNVAEIARWIFGEDEHSGDGIVAALTSRADNPVGLWDLLAFRLYCCTDRGGDTFNLCRALTLHGDSNAATSGPLRELVVREMRELSQAVFRAFDQLYVEPSVDLFEKIDNLSLAEICGDWAPVVEGAIERGEIDEVVAERELLSARSRMKTFIVYQLGTDRVEMGIGCGYYAESGLADDGGIRRRMNTYLYEVCFAPTADNGLRHFLDYMLINIDILNLRMSGETETEVHIAELTKVLLPDSLRAYWHANGQALRAFAANNSGREIQIGNFLLTYAKHLPIVFRTLDRVVAVEQGDVVA